MPARADMIFFVPIPKKPGGEPIIPAMSAGNLHPVFIKKIQTAMGHAAAGVFVQGRNHSFQKIRRHPVIARSDVQMLATRQLDAVIKAGVNAFPWSLRNSHARFTRRQFLDILPRTIVRITVTNNQLPGLKALMENRLKPLRQIRPRVQIRKTHGNFRDHDSAFAKPKCAAGISEAERHAFR